MYNKTYIKDFEEKKYYEFLSNPNKLKNIEETYLNQYTYRSDASWLAFKESLDHFVYMQLSIDPKFIDSKYFENYYKCITSIASKKAIKEKEEIYYPEFLTNIVLRDANLRKKINQKFLPSSTSNNIEYAIEKYKRRLHSIYNKILKGEKISQFELNLYSDYLYSSRDFSNKKGENFAKYLFNNIKQQDNYKTTPCIIGAISSYFTQEYQLDEEVKNSRFFVANYDFAKKVTLAHSSGNKRYCVFARDIIDNISLYNCSSLFKSRTSKNIDLYWIMMVSFHELTHQHQKLEMLRENLSSSGLCYGIRQVFNKYMPKIETQEECIKDYKVNHNSDEIEIQADEEGWRQSRKFIKKYINENNLKIITPDGKKYNKWSLAITNERAIEARRTFSLKKNIQTKQLKYYAEFDLENLEKIMKAHPEEIEKVPILKNVFDEHGNFKIREIFTSNLAKNSEEDVISRNSSHNAGLEILTYILIYKWKEIEELVKSGSLSKDEIEKINRNIYHTVHEFILKIRRFNMIEHKNIVHKSHLRIDSNQYDETKLKYNFEDKENIDKMYGYYAKCIAQGTLKRYKFADLAKEIYGIELDDEYIYYKSYMDEIYSNLTDDYKEKLEKAVIKHYTINNPYIEAIKKSILKQRQNTELNKMLNANESENTNINSNQNERMNL